jgi:hypothetical protein
MWSHDSVDGIKSALSTRFVMSASVKIRFERSLLNIPTTIQRLLKVLLLLIHILIQNINTYTRIYINF